MSMARPPRVAVRTSLRVVVILAFGTARHVGGDSFLWAAAGGGFRGGRLASVEGEGGMERRVRTNKYRRAKKAERTQVETLASCRS